jgi:hypothetical protein
MDANRGATFTSLRLTAMPLRGKHPDHAPGAGNSHATNKSHTRHKRA